LQPDKPLTDEDHGYAKFTISGEFHDVFRALDQSIVGPADGSAAGMVSTIDDVVLRSRLHPQLRKALSATCKPRVLAAVADTGVRMHIPDKLEPITEQATLEGPLPAVVDVFSKLAAILAAQAIRPSNNVYIFPGNRCGGLIGAKGIIISALAAQTAAHAVELTQPSDPMIPDLPRFAASAASQVDAMVTASASSSSSSSASASAPAAAASATPFQTGGCWCASSDFVQAMTDFRSGRAVEPVPGAKAQAWQVSRMRVFAGHDWASYAVLAYARCILSRRSRTESLDEVADEVRELCVSEGMPAVVPRSMAGKLISGCTVKEPEDGSFVMGDAAGAAASQASHHSARLPFGRDRRGSRDSRESRDSSSRGGRGRGQARPRGTSRGRGASKGTAGGRGASKGIEGSWLRG
jgi:hypothetical protein